MVKKDWTLRHFRRDLARAARITFPIADRSIIEEVERLRHRVDELEEIEEYQRQMDEYSDPR